MFLVILFENKKNINLSVMQVESVEELSFQKSKGNWIAGSKMDCFP